MQETCDYGARMGLGSQPIMRSAEVTSMGQLGLPAVLASAMEDQMSRYVLRKGREPGR